MARDFTPTAYIDLGYASTFGTGDFAVFLEISLDTTSGTQVFAGATLNNNANFWVGSNGGTSSFSLSGTTATGPSFSAATWHRVCAWRDGNNAYIGVDGTEGSAADVTGENVSSGGVNINVGRFGGSVFPINGKIGQFAMWDATLTAASRAALDAGVCPLFVQPADLVEYLPMTGAASTETSWFTGGGLSITGTTAAYDGLLPALGQPWYVNYTPAAGGGATIAALAHHHRMMLSA